MLIAVSTDGKDLSGAVSQRFETCRYLLIVETDDMSVETVENDGVKNLAGRIVDRTARPSSPEPLHRRFSISSPTHVSRGTAEPA